MKIKIFLLLSVVGVAQGIRADDAPAATFSEPAWVAQVDGILSSISGLVALFQSDAALYATEQNNISNLYADMQATEALRVATLSCAQDSFTVLQNQFNSCCTNANQSVAATLADINTLKMQTLALQSDATSQIATLDSTVATLSARLTQLYTDYCTLVGADQEAARNFIDQMTLLYNQCDATRQQKDSFSAAVSQLLSNIQALNVQTESDLNGVLNTVNNVANPVCVVSNPGSVTDYTADVNAYSDAVAARNDVVEPVDACPSN